MKPRKGQEELDEVTYQVSQSLENSSLSGVPAGGVLRSHTSVFNSVSLQPFQNLPSFLSRFK